MDKVLHTLQKLPGVTPEVAEKLKAAGLLSIPSVFALDDAALKAATGFSTAKVNALKAHKTKVLTKRKK